MANFILSGFCSFSGIAPNGALDPDISTNLNAMQLNLRAQFVPEATT